MIDPCPHCGSDAIIEIFALSEVYGSHMCGGCRRNAVAAVVFRSWRGRRVEMVHPSWVIPVPRVIGHPEEVTSAWPPTLTVWCGPDAPFPDPPSPEDILAVCGISPGEVFL